MQKSYELLGSLLAVIGAGVSLASYFVIRNIPLTSMGVAAFVLGLSSLLLPETVSTNPATALLLQSSALNTEAILDELSSEGIELPELDQGGLVLGVESDPSAISSKTVYLPPADNGSVEVFMPLGSTNPGDLGSMRAAPGIFAFLKGDRSRGIKVLPAGAEIGKLSEISESEGLDIEECLRRILVDSSELCASLNASELNDIIIVELNGVRIETTCKKYASALGTIPCSLAASTIATVRKRPVFILDERRVGEKDVSRFRLG